MKQINLVALLLVLSLLFAITDAVPCYAGSTKDSGCQDCVDTTPDSDCNFCTELYYKVGAKACKKCPLGTGKGIPNAPVLIETEAACFKCAPQLKCDYCYEDPYQCYSCASGSYKEPGRIGDIRITGCSTDCKSFSNVSFVPTDGKSFSCMSCFGVCKKCEIATNMKGWAYDPVINPQIAKCVEAADGYFIEPNLKDPIVIPTLRLCGANCKKCTDRTNCAECLSGWAKGATDKGECTSPTSTAPGSSGTNSTSSSSIAQVLLLSTSLAYIYW